MKEQEKEKKKKVNRHAEQDIPSKQDRSWVGDDQMPQEQFDKTEFEEKEVKNEPKRMRKCKP